MKCKCGKETLVIDSRPYGNTIKRRRACDCGNRFNTYELTGLELEEMKKDTEKLKTLREILK